MAAELLGMPELRIKPKRALELERRAIAVLNDRGIELRSDDANLYRLLWCIAIIYVPIILALLKKFVLSDASQATAIPVQQPSPGQPGASSAFKTASPAGVVATPLNPVPQADFGAPAFVPRQGPQGPIQTVKHPQGFPEAEKQILPDGSRAAGVLFTLPGDPQHPGGGLQEI